MWIITTILAIFVAFLQTTIAPSLSIFGGVADVILIIVLIYLFYGAFRQAGIFLLVSSIILSIISGLQIIYLLSPCFILILVYLFLSGRRIISRPSTLMSMLEFFLASILVSLIKIFEIHSFSTVIFTSVIVSAIFNSLIGATIYYICNKIYHLFNPQISRDKVKILSL